YQTSKTVRNKSTCSFRHFLSYRKKYTNESLNNFTSMGTLDECPWHCSPPCFRLLLIAYRNGTIK
ncbi:MAG: hypothetical protein RR954_09025, partial [Christensenellaceae bacterium]